MWNWISASIVIAFVVATVAAVVTVGFGYTPQSNAKSSCAKGALIGGAAGHFAHHTLLGAAAGCVIGHHERKLEERKEHEHKEDRDGY